MSQHKVAVKIQTRRFEFEEEFTNELSIFAKIHQYNDCKTFKTALKEWTQQDEIKELIELETERLKETGYNGNVNQKIFESARYYFRKKKPTTQEKCEKRKNKKRLSQLFLESIDKHIMSQMKEDILSRKHDLNAKQVFVLNSKITAADMYDDFCNTNKENIKQQILEILDKNVKKEEIELLLNKIKKTYKNRLYNITVILSK